LSSAPGRVDVYSKRTLDLLGRANLGQSFQFGRNQVGFVQGHAELRVRYQNIGMSRERLKWGDVFSQTLPGKPPDQCNFESCKHALLDEAQIKEVEKN